MDQRYNLIDGRYTIYSLVPETGEDRKVFRSEDLPLDKDSRVLSYHLMSIEGVAPVRLVEAYKSATEDEADKARPQSHYTSLRSIEKDVKKTKQILDWNL